ncbi:MAG: hypothetical protein P8Y97_07840 [Candidatus Lokiarchaeota archaeon]
MKLIDDQFIKTWKEKYLENDEEKYRDIIKLVKKDMKEIRTISKDVFEDIYKWKTRNRSIDRCDLDNYDKVQKENFSVISLLPDRVKIYVVYGLPGIRLPVASSILHFIHPEKFPIIDVRTTRLLQKFEYLNYKGLPYSYMDHPENYNQFRTVIFGIRKSLNKEYSLREIDRALFAYDSTNWDTEKKSYQKI